MNLRLLAAWFFALVAFVTALAVVVAKHDSRKLFVELQALEQERDRLKVEWNQLQLEEGAWSTQSRVETVARSQLNMHVPAPGEFKVIVQ